MVGPEREGRSTQALPAQVLRMEAQGLSQYNFRGLDFPPPEPPTLRPSPRQNFTKVAIALMYTVCFLCC